MTARNSNGGVMESGYTPKYTTPIEEKLAHFLGWRQAEGKISGLQIQPTFTFVVNGMLLKRSTKSPLIYRPSVMFICDDTTRVIDAGINAMGIETTPLKALMLACHGITVEVMWEAMPGSFDKLFERAMLKDG